MKILAGRELRSLLNIMEALHGVYLGLVGQTEGDMIEYEDWFVQFAMSLYYNELAYAEELYDPVGLTEKVKPFIRYNFNIACENLGYRKLFADEDVDPVVLNGLKIGEGKTGTHDFFSTKGAGYSKLAVEQVKPEDFDY